jgi:hypothetical protein
MKASWQAVSQLNLEIMAKLQSLTGHKMPPHIGATRPLEEADAIVSHIEVNNHHGVGVLLNRLFGTDTNILSIRSKDYYQGHQSFGAANIRISHGDVTQDIIISNILEALAGCTVNRILCVPYFADDVRTAIGLKEVFAAPLCTFLMDDQNLFADGIPDSLMRALLEKSSLVLAISPQLRSAYEQKYGGKVWFMPPVVPSHLTLRNLSQLNETALTTKSAVILGNIWGKRWVELLRRTVRQSGISLHWYNNGEFRWLPCSTQDLTADGIFPQEGAAHSDDVLIDILRKAPFVVLPSGVLDSTDDRRFIAKLSLPSRIPYIVATSQAPILVLGHPDTAAARFVTAAGVGHVAPYERHAFLEAVSYITRPDVNREMRRRALLLAGRFSDIGADEWIWVSLAKGHPVDMRYEELLNFIGGLN